MYKQNQKSNYFLTLETDQKDGQLDSALRI